MAGIITSGGTQGLIDILRVIQDATNLVKLLSSKDVKKLTDDLLERELAVEAGVKDANTKLAEAARTLADNQLLFAEITNAAELNKTVEERISIRENNVARKEAESNAKRKEIDEKAAELDKKDFALAEKFAKITDKEIEIEQKIQTTLNEAAALKAEYEKKLEAIKKLAG
jgi:hypothetical protein